MGLLLAGFWAGGLAIGIAITLALVAGAAHRSNFRGAFGVMLAYAFAFGLFIWAALFLVMLALWGGWH